MASARVSRGFRRAGIVVLSTGWLVPGCVGQSLLFSHLKSSGDEGIVHRFPHLAFSQDCLTLAGLWVGLVVVFWTWKCARRPRPS